MNIIKKDDEIEIFFNIRKIFIECLKPKNKKELALYNMYSNIFINILFLKCKYQKKTEDFIKKFLIKHKKILQSKISYIDYSNRWN